MNQSKYLEKIESEVPNKIEVRGNYLIDHNNNRQLFLNCVAYGPLCVYLSITK